MGVVKVVEKPNLYPGVTPLLRQTKGPVAYMGEVITNVHVFLSEPEVREATAAFGGLSREQADTLQAELQDARSRIAALEEEVSISRALVQACEQVYRRRRSAQQVAAPKAA